MEQIELSRRVLLVGIAATAIAACAPRPPLGPSALTLEEVIRRNTLARGGATSLDRVRSIAVDVEIIEGGQTLNGHYAATTDGLVRIDVYAQGKHVGSEGVDREGVWILGKDGPKPSVATGAANALSAGAETHLFGWHRFAERGNRLSLMPPETIDGVTYPVVKVGSSSYTYLDPVTWLAVRRRDVRAYHPDVDLTKNHIEVRFSDFVSVDGVVAAHRNDDYDLGTGKLVSTNRVLARRINPDLPAGYFDRNRRAPATW